MGMQLLERDHLLDELAHLLDEAARGTGRSALVTGEAGIGKSTLIERFAELHSASARFCWGHCEALFTPRPLGPLHDIAQQLQGHTGALLEQEANRTTIFSTFLEALSDGSLPTVAVIEDAHWADEATLDLLKFLGRRVQQASILLIITYRDDEIGPSHPLRFVLGDLPSRSTKRLRLAPLSREAVAALAHDAHHASHPDLTNLYTITGGNPFFVTEVLASDDSANVPDTVRDAVLARAARLSLPGRAVLELASVVPARTELWLLRAVLPQSADALEECLGAGILRPEPEAAAFRHELARLAVESTLPPHRQKELHAQILRALLEYGEEHLSLARLVHHATRAEDGLLVLRFAPPAAKQATQQGAHREAAEYYRAALRFADSLGVNERADLLEGLSYECMLIGQMSEAIQTCEAALALWRRLALRQRVGRNLRLLSRLYWYVGQTVKADHCVEASVRLLQTLPPDSQLAWSSSYRAMFAMLAEKPAEAQVWSNRAIELAEQLGDDEIVIHALNTLGMSRLYEGDKGGQVQVDQSLQLAQGQGFEEHAGRAYSNLSCYFVRFRDYANAHLYITTGIAYCRDRDLDLYTQQMLSWRAIATLEQGNWIVASEDAEAILGVQRGPPVYKIQAMVALSLIRMRRGDPGVELLLAEARDLALPTGELQRIAYVMAACAEVAWLRSDLAQCAAEAWIGYELASTHANPWAVGQMAFWLWRAGTLTEAPPGAALPFALHIAGDWQTAAAHWEQLGCPYEQALALSDGDAQAQRMALAILERLGARATIERLKQGLGASHADAIPRGPRPSTRNNPAGLTNQQLEVLALMADGLHNAEIAEALHVSLKTVEHHVSAVLAKLNARSRVQAVAQARNMGVVTKMGGQGQPI